MRPPVADAVDRQELQAFNLDDANSGIEARHRGERLMNQFVDTLWLRNNGSVLQELDGNTGQKAGCEQAMAYLAFALFGSGSGWLVIAALFMELAIYQKSFGLTTSNRMEIALDLGALCVPFFTFCRSALGRAGIDIKYPPVIIILDCINLLSLLAAACGLHSLPAVAAAAFIGGSCGYMSGVVHIPYILTRYENVYVAAFWAGDSAAGVLAALLALWQRPQLSEEDGRRFGPGLYYPMFVPVVVLALLAFGYIEATGVGRLPAVQEGDEDSWLPAPIGEGLDPQLEASPSSCEGHQSAQRAGKLSLWAVLPAGAVSHPWITAVLTFMTFFLSFTCWGFGDTMIPYACAGVPSSDSGDACVFWSGFCTVFAMLIGSNLAALSKAPLFFSLYVPWALYFTIFLLFCLATAPGGPWADPTLGAGGYWYFVLVVLAMRLLQSFSKILGQRILQTEYAPEECEGIASYFTMVNIAGNLVGVATATAVFG